MWSWFWYCSTTNNISIFFKRKETNPNGFHFQSCSFLYNLLFHLNFSYRLDNTKDIKILGLVLKGRSQCPFRLEKKNCLPLFIEFHIFGLSEIFIFLCYMVGQSWSIISSNISVIIMKYFTVCCIFVVSWIGKIDDLFNIHIFITRSPALIGSIEKLILTYDYYDQWISLGGNSVPLGTIKNSSLTKPRFGTSFRL